MRIAAGRHPVIEKLALDEAGRFIPNDLYLDENAQIAIITGPNMGGKSTYLRQAALIAIMAQMGSWVPAESSSLPVIDRVFTRIGASDNLARGRSTFMVEMTETAVILNTATERSFIILDEIGRGTATYDGLSLAWAVIEYIASNTRAKTLFATHYHEMTALSERLSSLACVTMRVSEWNDTIVFLHEVAPGTADRSYGIHVAKLAGLPNAVVARAEEVLRALEEGREGHKPLARIDDLPLFAAQPAHQPVAKTSAVEEALKTVEPDGLTPKQALEVLYDLKAKMQHSKP